ncbi:MAG TPA: ATP-binding protein [Vicinamibacteria bacterium]|nr:ATP-binding protein [Vicinamibacteria bacterium]
MPEPRYLEAAIRSDLREKMVLVAGPRQVGKTTLARSIQEGGAGIYLNWDNREDRKEIRAARWPGGDALVVLDELHKWRGWKGWLKGEYDKQRDRLRFLVTGSARMDVYRRGGDSLQGRYHHYRLHPFSVAELASGGAEPSPPAPGREIPIPRRVDPELVSGLLRASGFPEPLLSGSTRTHRRWQKERLDRFFREDVRDLEAVRELSSLQVLADLLPERVGSPLSLNALREDLDASHRGATHWIDVLERLYHVVRVRPWRSPRVRSLRRMPKAYLTDWTLVAAAGPRFENLVALHLLKFCHYLEDREGHAVALHYLRDRAGREVDFLVTLARTPWFAVEAKLSETAIDPSLRYFRDRLRLPFCYQVVLEGRRDFVEDGIRCLPAGSFLAALI